MKTYLLPVALATLAVSAIAGAQTPPSSTPPDTSTSTPSSSMQTPSTSGSSSSYSHSDSSKSQLKDCIAKQKASNSTITDAEAKRACETESTGQ